MKKLLSFILVFGMTFSLTACGSKTDSGKTAASAPTQGNNTVTESKYTRTDRRTYGRYQNRDSGRLFRCTGRNGEQRC